MYTPEKTANYESRVALAAAKAMEGKQIIENPVSVWMFIGCSIPSSWSKKKQKQAALNEIVPAKKPDVDNVIKAVFDGMNGVVWRDDVQVVALKASKGFSTTPGVIVEVTS
jgi:Holliday junction resolvase RusA-like endonuclease